jgi:hypothetical protein
VLIAVGPATEALPHGEVGMDVASTSVPSANTGEEAVVYAASRIEPMPAQVLNLVDPGRFTGPPDEGAASGSPRGGANSIGSVSLKSYGDDPAPPWRRIFAFESE